MIACRVYAYVPVSYLNMKHTIKTTVFLVLILSFCSCKSDDGIGIDPNSEPNDGLKIMPLGASRVEGDRPEFESYRYELWKLMVDAGWEFDYIGTREDEASYPSHSNRNFDLDHEGRGGWTSGQILAGLDSWMQSAGVPDIVLFSSPAGNDALEGLDYEQAIDNINSAIDMIQAANADVTIIIEQLAPGQSEIMTGDLLTYFNDIQADILKVASTQTTSTSKVIAVDMFSGFTDELLADDVHYNEAGARFVAARYFAALEPYFD